MNSNEIHASSPFNDGWTREFYKNQALVLDIDDIGGDVVKDNETYILKDNKKLKNLVLSSTLLKPKKETRGHSHIGQEEIYFFIYGQGKMKLDGATLSVKAGDVVQIPDGAFHKVINESDESLYFVCVFDGKRYDDKVETYTTTLETADQEKEL
jgi:mannose-6-phosphate isomerase-like protein (cupin superfamily)|tara:strand:+ start:572 stop:1033 length:462 start_codon:yes stop_codon:yes gene_type:complete